MPVGAACTGTSNEPFVIANALVEPVLLAQLPVPEKVPVVRLAETVAITTEPASSEQMKFAFPLAWKAMNRMTSVQDVVFVDTQLGSIVAVPTVWRLMT